MQDTLKTVSENSLVVAIVQLMLGAWLLGWWSYRRDQRTSRRQEAIKFIEETTSLLNDALANLFFIVRNKNPKSLKRFQILVGRLFRNRLGIRVKSQALLGSLDFSKNYEIIMHQLSKCRIALQAFWELQDTQKAVETIESAIPTMNREDFRAWANAEGNQPSPWKHFYILAEYIWSTTDNLLANALDSALKSKKKFKFQHKDSLRQRDHD